MMVASFIWLPSEQLVYLSSSLKEVADKDSAIFIVESVA
jgi:hypothetical protein